MNNEDPANQASNQVTPTTTSDQDVMQGAQYVAAAPSSMNAPTANPGKTLGIVSIVMGVLGIWLGGLPVAIVSLMKSRRAKQSATWGIVGVVVNTLSLILSIIVAVMFFAVFANMDDNKAKSGQSSTQTNAKSTDTPNAELVDIPLSQQYKVTGQLGKAYWAADIPKGDWEADILDQGGKNHFIRKDKTAEFTTFQGYDPSLSGDSDLKATRAGIASLTQGGKSLELGDESTTAFIEMGRGKTVEFVVQDYTYSTNDGQVMKARMTGRAFDGGQYLYAWYVSTPAMFSESDWQMFVNGLSVNDGAI